MDWGELYFILHKHCHLDDEKIMEYTLPKITLLSKKVKKYIQFEIEMKMPAMPFGMFGGGQEEQYKEADEDDINDFMRMLGGS